MESIRARGFTLIELLIVLAVIGIVGSMALPSFAVMLENNRRVAAVNDLLSSIHIARSEAITRNQRISICRSNAAKTACVTSGGGWKDGWLIFRDANGDGAITAADADEILRTGDGLRARLDIVSTEYANSITFLPNGRVAGAGGSLLLCTSGEATAVRRIDIDRTGRPRSVAQPADSCA